MFTASCGGKKKRPFKKLVILTILVKDNILFTSCVSSFEDLSSFKGRVACILIVVYWDLWVQVQLSNGTNLIRI